MSDTRRETKHMWCTVSGQHVQTIVEIEDGEITVTTWLNMADDRQYRQKMTHSIKEEEK